MSKSKFKMFACPTPRADKKTKKGEILKKIKIGKTNVEIIQELSGTAFATNTNYIEGIRREVKK